MGVIMKSTTIDQFWRILIPKSFRPLFKSKDATVSFDENKGELIVRPIKGWEEMRGFLGKTFDSNKLIKDRETQWH